MQPWRRPKRSPPSPREKSHLSAETPTLMEPYAGRPPSAMLPMHAQPPSATSAAAGQYFLNRAALADAAGIIRTDRENLAELEHKLMEAKQRVTDRSCPHNLINLLQGFSNCIDNSVCGVGMHAVPGPEGGELQGRAWLWLCMLPARIRPSPGPESHQRVSKFLAVSVHMCLFPGARFAWLTFRRCSGPDARSVSETSNLAVKRPGGGRQHAARSVCASVCAVGLDYPECFVDGCVKWAYS
jgi:hypothetical protein